MISIKLCCNVTACSDADSEIEFSVQESEGRNIREHYPTDQSLMIELQASEMNWFDFVDRLENVLENTENVHDILEEFRNHIQLDSHKMETLKLSYDAYIASKSEQYSQERTVRTVNGDIVSIRIVLYRKQNQTIQMIILPHRKPLVVLWLRKKDEPSGHELGANEPN